MMMQRHIDRRRSTQGSFLGSIGLHALLLLLAMLGFGRSAAARFDDADPIARIAYIEAEYGEDVAAKVRLKTQPAVDFSGPGIETRSAVKPKQPSSAPATQPQAPKSDAMVTAMADVSAPKLERSDPTFTEPRSERLNSRASIEMTAAPDLKSTKSDQDLAAAKGTPTLNARRLDATPALPKGGKALVSRGQSSLDSGGPSAPNLSGGGGSIADAGPSTPALSSRGRSEPGAGVPTPSGGLSSTARRGEPAIAVQGPPAPGGGGSAGQSGRRTVLDYGSGSGSGGGSLRGRAGGLAEPRKAEQPKASGADAAQIEKAQPVAASQNSNMTITGQIAGRKILESATPEYTAQARRNGWEGVVAVHFTVLPDGRVKDNMYFEQTSAHRDLNQAAMNAIKKFRFAPLSADKAAVEQWGIVTIVFRLH